jgi:hypothetical protein
MKTTICLPKGVRPLLNAILLTATLGLAPALSSCTEIQGAKSMPVTSFITMAQASACHDLRNRLFLIDQKMVFWDRLGNCPDNGHEQTLFGSTPDQVLAVTRDSIAGPRTNYNDDNYRAMFDTMMKNRDKADLGLGSTHQVQAITF